MNAYAAGRPFTASTVYGTADIPVDSLARLKQSERDLEARAPKVQWLQRLLPEQGENLYARGAPHRIRAKRRYRQRVGGSRPVAVEHTAG